MTPKTFVSSLLVVDPNSVFEYDWLSSGKVALFSDSNLELLVELERIFVQSESLMSFINSFEFDCHLHKLKPPCSIISFATE